MTLFPFFADLHDRPVLVVGGGAVATRKVRALLDAGAAVLVGAPEITAELAQWVEQSLIRHVAGEFDPLWLDDIWLVVAATNEHSVNHAVAQAAASRRIFANVVDNPTLSSFQVPSIVDRSPMVVAISSAGAAPVLARRVRERLETLLDHSLGPLTALAGAYRARIRARRPTMFERRRFYDWLLDGPVAALLKKSRPAEAEQLLAEALDQDQPPARGSVILVGAGPGDPGLLTLNALRALNEADIILHDRLVSDQIMALARKDAERISVGKLPGENHDATQARIHALLVQHARAGRRVVRLKGGDAFIFGRGGEELEHLRGHGIDYEVVPGITAALACAAYAGIPLTHRDYSQSLHLTTAHCRKDADNIDWAGLARERQTLAFYMGVGQLETLSARLVEHGRDPRTPFALIENGSRPEQRVLSGNLKDLADLARAHDIKSPALLIVGEVAALTRRLQWFGKQVENEPALATPGT